MVKKCTYWNKYLLVLVSMLFLSTSLFAQSKQVSGLVTGQDGEPIIGASIIIKGTYSGTVTDFEGKYAISVEGEDAFLVYSFIGMKTIEMPVADKTIINVTMEDNTIGMDEVVVVGYGTQRKADLTGAVSTVEGETMIKGATPNLTESLAGKIAGVTTMSRGGSPGAEDVDLIIRGKSTFSDKNNTPLVLVDGIERGMSRINPNDIETVTVLKDAASAAIYGVKGANGVILITTKRAKEGEAEITYNGTFGIQKPLYLPNRMNSYDYATHLNEALQNLAERSGGEYSPAYTDEQIAAFKDGSGTNTDWWKEVMKDQVPVKTHAITVANGTKKVRYRLSLEYLNQDGLYKLANYERYNLRANIDSEITENLSIALDISGRKDERNKSADESSAWGLINQSYPTFEPYVEIDGNKELHWNGLNVSPVGAFLNSGYDKNTGGVFQSSLSLNYKVPFVKGLTAKYKYAFDRENYQRKTLDTPYTYYTGSDAIADKKQSIPEIALTQRMTERTKRTGQFIMNYDNSFGKHKIGAMFVFEHSDYYNEWIEAYRDGFVSSTLDQMFAGATARIGNDGKANESKRVGYAGRVNYNYNDKYLVQLNARYDKSFNFPKDNAGGWFPAFSLAWRVSEESFMNDIDWISNIKLRLSGGVYGNDNIAPFQYLSLFGFSSTRGNPSGTITGGYNQGISPSVIPNPVVTWELAKIFNLGVDYTLWGGKISGDFEVFKKRTEDLLISRKDIPLEVGASLAPENIGVVENRGFEASIRHKGKIREFNYSLGGTVSYATSEIKEMSEAPNVPDALKQTGRPFDSRYGYQSLGLFKDAQDVAESPDQSFFGAYQSGDIKYKDISGPDGTPDGIIDANDRTYIGRGGMPELTFGLNTHFSYKGFELSASFQGATRYTFRYKPSPFVNNSNGISRFTDAWTEENPNTWLPRNYQGASSNNDANSDYWLTDGWFVKLRNAEFAYNVPELKVMKDIGVKALRVSVSGSNLFSVTNIDSWDPEASDLGTHPWYYMQMRTINFGVQATF